MAQIQTEEIEICVKINADTGTLVFCDQHGRRIKGVYSYTLKGGEDSERCAGALIGVDFYRDGKKFVG